MNTDITDRPSFVEGATLTNVFAEAVPAKNWKQRMSEGLPPSMFWSLKGDIVVGNAVVRAEMNIDALNAEGEIVGVGIERANKDGVVLVVLPPEAKSHVIGIHCKAGPDGRPQPELDADKMPVQAEPLEFKPGWRLVHACKFRANVDSTKALKLTDVKISYDDAVTQTGHLCARIHVKSYEVVDAPARVKATGPAIGWGKLGASASYSAAARRTVMATQATASLPPAPAADTLADRAAAAGNPLTHA